MSAPEALILFSCELMSVSFGPNFSLATGVILCSARISSASFAPCWPYPVVSAMIATLPDLLARAA
ncbi:hypothetical protein D3C71_2040080 [compost metagenome]